MTDFSHCPRILERSMALLTLYSVIMSLLFFGCEGFHRQIGPEVEVDFILLLPQMPIKLLHHVLAAVETYIDSALHLFRVGVVMYALIRPIAARTLQATTAAAAACTCKR